MKENNQYTAEIYVMGVLPDYHKQGIGKALFNRILQWAKENGYEFLPELWGKENPCLIMIQHIV